MVANCKSKFTLRLRPACKFVTFAGNLIYRLCNYRAVASLLLCVTRDWCCERSKKRIGAYEGTRRLTTTMPAVTSTKPSIAPGGIKAYYQAKIEAAELTINHKTQNLRRLEAQRNALNARGMCHSCEC